MPRIVSWVGKISWRTGPAANTMRAATRPFSLPFELTVVRLSGAASGISL